MKIGHRRTESDNFYANPTSKKTQLVLHFKRNSNDIEQILKETNHKNKTKTISVESIETPQARSQQDLMFYFGKKGYDTPTSTTSQFQEELHSIP